MISPKTLHCKYVYCTFYSCWMCYVSHCSLTVLITARGSNQTMTVMNTEHSLQLQFLLLKAVKTYMRYSVSITAKGCKIYGNWRLNYEAFIAILKIRKYEKFVLTGGLEPPTLCSKILTLYRLSYRGTVENLS